MTPTLILWIKIALAVLLVWGIWGIIKVIRKQKKLIPGPVEEWKKLLPELLFPAICIFFFFWIQNNFQRPIDRVIEEKNKPLQKLYFTNLATGMPDSLGAYRGKTVILNLWATWCGPCRKELPSLQELQEEYKKDLVILALSDEALPIIRTYAKKEELNLITGSFHPHPLLDSLGTRPVSILIDADNHVQDVVIGARGYSFFRKWIAPYLHR